MLDAIAALGGLDGCEVLSRNAAWRTRNLGRLLYDATHLFIGEKLRDARASGLDLVTEVQMALVHNLDVDGTRLTVLAKRARMTKQSMRELVQKVETLGFVERRADAEDGRAKIVMFTPAGLQMLDRLGQAVAVAERRMVVVMGAVFVAELKERLTAYAAANVAVAHDLRMSDKNAAWRQDTAGRMLLSASGVFADDVLRVVHDGGFHPVRDAQLSLFRNLDIEGTRLTDIAARARMTKQAMAELVDKTEALGFVLRQVDPDDGRAKLVVFTPAGLELLDQFCKATQAAERRAGQVMGRRFVVRLRAGLEAYLS